MPGEAITYGQYRNGSRPSYPAEFSNPLIILQACHSPHIERLSVYHYSPKRQSTTTFKWYQAFNEKYHGQYHRSYSWKLRIRCNFKLTLTLKMIKAILVARIMTKPIYSSFYTNQKKYIHTIHSDRSFNRLSSGTLCNFQSLAEE